MQLFHSCIFQETQDLATKNNNTFNIGKDPSFKVLDGVPLAEILKIEVCII